MKAKLHLNITNTQLCFAFEEEIILGRREEGEVSGTGAVAKANDSVSQARNQS